MEKSLRRTVRPFNTDIPTVRKTLRNQLVTKSVGDHIDAELLDWYYSLVFESEESHALVEVANNILEIADPPGRRSVSGRSTHQDLVDRSWASYDRIVDDAVSSLDPIGLQYGPHVRTGQEIARSMAWIMKAGMRVSGYDDALVRREMARRK